MKLILTAEVDHLGSSGDIVEVKDGYGRNFLLPRGLAIVASRGAERQAEEIRRAREVKAVQGLEHAKELKTTLEGLTGVQLSVKASADTGKLFGSVTAADVVAAKLSTQPDSEDPQMLLDTLRAFDAVAHELAGITS